MSQFQNPLSTLGQEAEIKSPELSGGPVVDAGRPAPQGEMPIWDTTDALMAAPRGIVGAAQGIYNTIDWVGFDVLPDWKTNPLGESRSIAGGLLEGLVEFGSVLIPGMGAAGAVGAAAKAGRLGGAAAKGLGWLAKAPKGASAGAKIASEVARATAVGAVADFTLTTPGQQRLSNLALQFESPWLNNDVTKFLASGEGEGELEARLKGAVEGMALGVPVDFLVEGIMHGIKAVRHGRLVGEEVVRAGGSVDDASEAAARAEADYAAQNAEPIRRASEAFSRSGADDAADQGADAMMASMAPQGAVGNRATVIENGALDRPLAQAPGMIERIQKVIDANTKAQAQPQADDALAAELRQVATAAWDKSNNHEDVVAAINQWKTEKGFNSTRDLERASKQASGVFKEAQSQAFDGQFSEAKNASVEQAKSTILSELNDMVSRPDRYSVKQASEALQPLLVPGENLDKLLAEAGVRKSFLGVTTGGSLRETIQSVSSIPDLDPGLKSLADFMLRSADDVSMGSTRTLSATGGPANFLGSYDPSSRIARVFDVADVSSPSDAAAVVLHEAVHGSVLWKINQAVNNAVGGSVDWYNRYADDLGEGAALSSRRSAKEMREIIGRIKDKDVKRLFELYDQVMKNIPDEWKNSKSGGQWSNNDTHYGLTNIQEFIAEAMTNKKFQKMLAGIQLPDQQTNLWQAFLDIVSKLLGTDKLYGDMAAAAGISGQDNVLASVIDVGGKIISRSEASFRGRRKAITPAAQNIDGLSVKVAASIPDPSKAGSGNPRAGSMPVPNSPRPDPVGPMRQQIEEIVKRVRGNPSGWTPTDLQELNRLVDETTRSGLLNTGYGAQNGTVAGEFILAFAEMVSENKDLYEGIKRVRSNAETAADRDSFLSVMESIGGFSPEQKIKFAQTISDWHGPMFEDGAAVVSAMVGAQMNLYLDAIKRGATEGERSALYNVLVTMAAADRKNANIIGRSLQNRKMMWKEELAARISQLTPQQVSDQLKFMQGMVEIGILDKDTFFQIRDNALGSGWMGHALWAYKNSILSGPASSAINVISGSAAWLYMPLERALGYAVDNMFSGNQAGKAAKELSVYKELPSVIHEVWNTTKASWKQAGDSITLGSEASPYGEFLNRRGFVPKSNGNVFTTAMDYFVWGSGQAVGIAGVPTKLMGATDELFSSVSARADMRAYLIHNAPDNIKASPRRLAAYVRSKMRQAFNDVGALYSEESVRGQVMREAKAKGFEPGSPEWTAYVQNGMARRWVAPQGKDRLDMEFMQRASAGVRRRAQQTTFKRDYTDILEEAHSMALGTRTLAGLGRNATGLIRDVPALGFLMPFVKTPTNLLIWAVERNPIEATLNLRKHIDNPEMRGEMVGRLSAGLVMYGVAVTAALNGAITGRGPSDPNVRKALMDSGWQPNSIRIGDRYVSYSRFDPYASILGLMGDAVDIANQKYLSEKEQAEMIDMTAKVVVGSIANNMVNKTYLTGLRNLLDALTNWETKGQAFLGSLAGGVIPNALTQPYTHFQDEMAAPREIMDRIMARIPGYGASVDKRRNALGEAMDNPAEAWNLLLPSRVTKESRDPVKQELSKLLVGFSTPSPSLDGGIDLTEFRSSTGQTAFDRYQQLTSETSVGGLTLKDRLAQIIRTSQYQAMPETSVDGVQTTRVGILRSEIGRYRRAALQRLLQEYPDIANRRREIDNIKSTMRRGN